MTFSLTTAVELVLSRSKSKLTKLWRVVFIEMLLSWHASMLDRSTKYRDFSKIKRIISPLISSRSNSRAN